MMSSNAKSSHTRKRPHSASQSSPPPKRAISACESCRARKTRCSNERPSCSYCSKHELQCEYPEDALSLSWQDTGDRILAAIDDLKTSIEKQYQSTSLPLLPHLPYGNTERQPIQVYPTSHDVLPHQISSARLLDSGNAPSYDLLQENGKPRLQHQGMESVLDWSILKQFRPPGSLFSDSNALHSVSHQVPVLNRYDLTSLVNKYIDGVHIKNPVLDLTELQRNIDFVLENGLDWSTSTCLTALVCAIGAISQQNCDHRLSLNGQTPRSNITVSTPAPASEIEKSLSLQWFGIAVKRLGLAISENSLQAVQCLCLAAIWHMHQLQPTQAWKYLNLAGAAWHTLNMQDQSDDQEALNMEARSLTVMQALYFTIWKSEGELRFELDIPAPLLENIRFPYLFPQPPDLDRALGSSDEVAEDERSWLYYLADIAARHLMNRLLEATPNLVFHSEMPLSKQDIKSMVARAEILEAQINDWQKSLPAIFSFDTPIEAEITTATFEDDRAQVLWNRYLSYRLLVNRPFVRLLVDQTNTTSLVGNILREDPVLERQVVDRSSLCLHYCVLKIAPVAPYRHQGLWYGLRDLGSNTLALCAVHLAQQYGTLPLTREQVRLPSVWQQKVTEGIVDFEPFWTETQGGIRQILEVIRSVLSAVSAA